MSLIRLQRPTHCRRCGKRLRVEDRWTEEGGVRCGVLRYCPNVDRHNDYFYGEHDVWDKHIGLWWGRPVVTPKPGIPLNEPQTEAGWCDCAEGSGPHRHAGHDLGTQAGRDLLRQWNLEDMHENWDDWEFAKRLLAIEREAQGIPLIDVELLARALRESQTTKSLTMRLGRFNEVWWERFASEVAAEYARLKGER